MFWWLWIVFGVGLLVMEMLTPSGFTIFFFGVSAIAVGILALAGFLTTGWVQWLWFSVIAVLAVVILRRPLRTRLNFKASDKAIDSMVGEQATVSEVIPARGAGRVDVRGSTWTARAKSDVPIATGQRCRIDAVDGLTLWVHAE